MNVCYRAGEWEKKARTCLCPCRCLQAVLHSRGRERRCRDYKAGCHWTESSKERLQCQVTFEQSSEFGEEHSKQSEHKRQSPRVRSTPGMFEKWLKLNERRGEKTKTGPRRETGRSQGRGRQVREKRQERQTLVSCCEDYAF